MMGLMKAPVCRVCGKAHWGNEPHVFSGTDILLDVWEDRSGQVLQHGGKPEGERAGSGDEKATASSPPPEPVLEDVSTEALRKRRWREKNREHYNTYMRRYMAKKRREQKK